jgi:benzodiazapine receptor
MHNTICAKILFSQTSIVVSLGSIFFMGKYAKILIMVATCLSAGYFAGMATQSSVQTWFTTIQKPFFNPPSWVFAPVWTLLYICMGIAAGLVWNRLGRREGARKALLLFAAQMVLNILWSFLFFGLRNPFLALIEIILLWLLIYETMLAFRLISTAAGRLFIPYLLWVSFAAILNGAIWWLNR